MKATFNSYLLAFSNATSPEALTVNTPPSSVTSLGITSPFKDREKEFFPISVSPESTTTPKTVSALAYAAEGVQPVTKEGTSGNFFGTPAA